MTAGADPTAADKVDVFGVVNNGGPIFDALCPNEFIQTDRHTPLHFACEFAQSEVVRALLASGADLHAKDIVRRLNDLWCFINRIL
jgi:hypothetical protein